MSSAPAPDLMDRARAALREHWHHDDFRPQQAEAIRHVLDGEDVFAVLPTGYGKSVIFQVPALLVKGTALVISPLIALMKDQCDDAAARGLRAGFLNSHVDEDLAEERLDDLRAGKYRLFYVAPERLRSKRFLNALRRTDVSYLVVDEAHCASLDGFDFRPAYQRISDLLALFAEKGERPPIIAVTATATLDIEADIVRGVGIDPQNYKRVVADPIRPNLTYEIRHGDPWRNLATAIGQCNPYQGRYIFYSATRGGAAKIAEMVAEARGESCCGVYHAGLLPRERTAVQEAFKRGTTPMVAATNAFGMGIDVPDIRAVIHFGIPEAIEAYVQEAGRAGRDGAPARVTCIVDPWVTDLRQRMLDAENPPYAHFQHVWRWLHDTLGEGEVLFKSAMSIAAAIQAVYGVTIPPDGVGGVLATLEAFGAVGRGYAPSGMLLQARRVDVRDAAVKGHAALSANATKTFRALWEEVVQPDVLPGVSLEARVDIVVDCARLSSLTGFTEGSVRKHLNEAPFCTIGRAFSGKTTEVLRWGARLVDVLPAEKVERKRRRAQARLQQMLAYTRTADPRGFIRGYFLRGPEGGV